VSRVLSYAEVGATRSEALPNGYRHVHRRTVVGTGPSAFRAAVDALARWDVQRGAGLRVRGDAPRVALGSRAEVGLGVGPLRVWAPCEVVWVVDEPTRWGFAYGTLDGHPECGEEAFIISTDDADQVWFEIRAFSRPAAWYARLGGPVGHLIQEWVTDRYVAAACRAARG